MEVMVFNHKGNVALNLNLDTLDGRYISMTQYNRGTTSVAFDNLTVPEITKIRKGLDELEAILSQKEKDK